jgi:hypothetical protein
MRTPDLYAKVGETFSPRFTLQGADGAPQSFAGGGPKDDEAYYLVKISP